MDYDLTHFIYAGALAVTGLVGGYILGSMFFTQVALGGLFIQVFGTANAASTANNLITSSATYPLMLSFAGGALGFLGGWHKSVKDAEKASNAKPAQ